MTALSSLSTTLGSALLAAALLTPAPAEAQRSRSGMSGSSMSSPTRMKSSSSNLGLHTSLAIAFLMATSSSDQAEDPAKVKAYQDQLDKIIIDPSAENSAALGLNYVPHAGACQETVNPKGLITDSAGAEKVRPAFQECLTTRAANEDTITAMTTQDPKSIYYLSRYADYLPACQKENGITPGVRDGVKIEQAKAAFNCALDQRRSYDNKVLTTFAVSTVALPLLLTWGCMGFRRS